MTTSANSPAARLKKLKSVLPKAQALNGRKLTAQPMADLLGVSWVALRKWCTDLPGFEASGAFERGERGVEWQFKPVATVRWLIKHFESLSASRAKRAKTIRNTVAGNDADELPEDLSIAELRQLLQTSMTFQELRERQGRQVDAAEVLRRLQRVFSEIQAAGLRTAQESDPNGRWSPETRSIVEDVVRSMLLAQHRAAEACLREFDGGSAKSAEARG